VDCNGRTIWIADAHRDDGKRFVVRFYEKLTAFIQLESAIRACGDFTHREAACRGSQRIPNFLEPAPLDSDPSIHRGKANSYHQLLQRDRIRRVIDDDLRAISGREHQRGALV
jgi:hypothetical protein